METEKSNPPEQSSVSAATSSPVAISGRGKADILFSLLRINPFANLAMDDFNIEKTASFTVFSGRHDLYSFPDSAEEAVTRVKKNVKLFIGYYILLFYVFFLISL
ncbi:PREDICTED: PRA1 family protein H-like [Tarenaya hassleriana]|uniref:PRA1 family protein H-like n=1 Tax=Tarenaya hassleriana TaxID=28532 RepID=UPI00053C9C3C|nr:PREDICTED: PRA1 family protein H-like [Tarenaya hassleriana]